MKTRIVVLQMKDIVRTAIIAAVGLALVILLIWAIVPSRGTQQEAQAMGAFVPGSYTAYIVIHNRPISVVVTVDEDSILNVELLNMAETQEVFYPLLRPTMERLSAEIVRYQSTEISAPLEISVTSRILLDAVNHALNQAKASH
ncbi:MAG: hypothetical protein FWB71_01590 [Defluviitaleaceae bacterium]|nr:hypothetical protein [Defluviitaleaceae bacterium]